MDFESELSSYIVKFWDSVVLYKLSLSVQSLGEKQNGGAPECGLKGGAGHRRLPDLLADLVTFQGAKARLRSYVLRTPDSEVL